MTKSELRKCVQSKLEEAIRAQRKSWDAALETTELTGYAGDIYAYVAETAGALKDDEAIPDGVVDELISPASTDSLSPGPAGLPDDAYSMKTRSKQPDQRGGIIYAAKAAANGKW